MFHNQQELDLEEVGSHPILNQSYLALIILIEGFVSIATEILAIRQLLPVAGGSVIVTSLVIGIFLLFLALGYHVGGKLNGNPIAILRKNFFIAAMWLGFGLSYLFISLFFLFIHQTFGPHVIYPLILYLLLVIAPLIYLLGQTLPISMNMIQLKYKAGLIGGYALSLSTIGSFLGSILTSLVTLHYLGVAYTVFINSFLLILLSLLLTTDKELWLSKLVPSVVAISMVFILNIYAEKLYFILTNSYANYQIFSPPKESGRDEKILIINEALSSRLNKEAQGFVYIEMIKKILFHDLKLRGADILVLGAGGFSLSAAGTFNNRITYVDIDHQIKNVAVPNFIDKLNSQFIADDARHFLNANHKQYAAIVIDVYSDFKAIPAHLVTVEYMQAIKDHLAPQGVAIFNMVSNPMLTDPYSKRLDNTIRAVFQNCMAQPKAYSNRVSNIIYICAQSGLNDKTIYTDDLNHSTTDSFNW